MLIDTARFKQRLEHEREALLKELAELGRRDPTVAGNWDAQSGEEGEAPDADLNVAADRIEELISNNGVVSELETRLANVNESLGRIVQGTYGTCTACGKPIEEDRLDANPSATTCIEHRDS